jgi:hypothetical protein
MIHPRARLAAALALLAPLPALAQVPTPYVRPGNEIGTGQSLPLSNNASNITPDDTHSAIAPRLPDPPVADNAGPMAFLHAARDSLIAGRTGEAQEALERAESRILDRAVPPSAAGVPAQSPILQQIAAARGALAQGDRQHAIQLIDQAIRAPAPLPPG